MIIAIGLGVGLASVIDAGGQVNKMVAIRSNIFGLGGAVRDLDLKPGNPPMSADIEALSDVMDATGAGAWPKSDEYKARVFGYSRAGSGFEKTWSNTISGNLETTLPFKENEYPGAKGIGIRITYKRGGTLFKSCNPCEMNVSIEFP